MIRPKQEIAGTVVLSKAFIALENPELAERIEFYPFNGAGQDMPPMSESTQLACLAIGAGISDI